MLAAFPRLALGGLLAGFGIVSRHALGRLRAGIWQASLQALGRFLEGSWLDLRRLLAGAWQPWARSLQISVRLLASSLQIFGQVLACSTLLDAGVRRWAPSMRLGRFYSQILGTLLSWQAASDPPARRRPVAACSNQAAELRARDAPPRRCGPSSPASPSAPRPPCAWAPRQQFFRDPHQGGGGVV